MRVSPGHEGRVAVGRIPSCVREGHHRRGPIFSLGAPDSERRLGQSSREKLQTCLRPNILRQHGKILDTSLFRGQRAFEPEFPLEMWHVPLDQKVVKVSLEPRFVGFGILCSERDIDTARSDGGSRTTETDSI